MYYWDNYRGVYSCVFPGERGGSRIKLLRMKIKWGKKGGREGEGKREENGRKGREWKEKGLGRRGKGEKKEKGRVKGKGK